MPKIPQRPKLTNRGPAGLLTKIRENNNPSNSIHHNKEARKDWIAPSLAGMIVRIDSLTLDPDNARLHPERNMEAIKESLRLFGQVKPIVAREQSKVVIAGNGTLEAAKALGWDHIAVSFVQMTEVEAAGYGLADNRTSELARWDFEIVARLDKLLQEANQAPVGWTSDELEVLRMADWTPPAVEENGEGFGDGTSGKDSSLLCSFTPDQHQMILAAVNLIREEADDKELDQSECLVRICTDWLSSKLPKEETIQEGAE